MSDGGVVAMLLGFFGAFFLIVIAIAIFMIIIKWRIKWKKYIL